MSTLEILASEFVSSTSANSRVTQLTRKKKASRFFLWKWEQPHPGCHQCGTVMSGTMGAAAVGTDSEVHGGGAKMEQLRGQVIWDSHDKMYSENICMYAHSWMSKRQPARGPFLSSFALPFHHVGSEKESCIIRLGSRNRYHWAHSHPLALSFYTLRNEMVCLYPNTRSMRVDVVWGGVVHKEESFGCRKVGRAGEDGLSHPSTSCLSPQALGWLTVPIWSKHGDSLVCISQKDSKWDFKAPIIYCDNYGPQQCQGTVCSKSWNEGSFSSGSRCTTRPREEWPWFLRINPASLSRLYADWIFTFLGTENGRRRHGHHSTLVGKPTWVCEMNTPRQPWAWNLLP